MGTGRGATFNDEEFLMWMTRLQWNIIGGPVAFSGSVLTYHTRPVFNLTFAAVTNHCHP